MHAITILLLLAALTIAPACAADNGGIASDTKADVTYESVEAKIREKLQQLEKLGGGIKPFTARLDEISKINQSGNTADAMRQVNSLSRSVDDQLKDLAALRSAPKKVVHAVVVRPSSAQPLPPQLANLTSGNARQLIMNYVQDGNVSTQSINHANFNGSANDYVQAVAKDVLARELGGLPAPCEGPFRLERFRNLHRIHDLRKQGRDVSGFLSYHNVTEEVAAGVKNEPGKISELTSRVRYLEQQLGLNPLASSASFNSI